MTNKLLSTKKRCYLTILIRIEVAASKPPYQSIQWHIEKIYKILFSHCQNSYQPG